MSPQPAPRAPLPVTVGVMAKTPRPGQVKTRLCPPLTLEQAARVAGAALRDTLRAMDGARAVRKVVVLEGLAITGVPDGFDVVPQRPGTLAERLVGATHDIGGPLVLIAMDTPQVTAALLDLAAASLLEPGVDATLGRCPDGGYWAIGLRETRGEVFDGVPMSRPRTAARQRERLDALGMRVVELPSLRDVDAATDLTPVAAEAPGTEFAREVGRLARLGVA